MVSFVRQNRGSYGEHDMMIIFMVISFWIMGFASCWLYAKLKLEGLERKVTHLTSALHCAGDTIIAQSDEIHQILEKAASCESGIIN